jgi:hypothetical protein
LHKYFSANTIADAAKNITRHSLSKHIWSYLKPSKENCAKCIGSLRIKIDGKTGEKCVQEKY